MKAVHAILLLLMVLFVLSFLKVWSEPLHHESKVDFWTWCDRELWELKHGEAE